MKPPPASTVTTADSSAASASHRHKQSSPGPCPAAALAAASTHPDPCCPPPPAPPAARCSNTIATGIGTSPPSADSARLVYLPSRATPTISCTWSPKWSPAAQPPVNAAVSDRRICPHESLIHNQLQGPLRHRRDRRKSWPAAMRVSMVSKKPGEMINIAAPSQASKATGFGWSESHTPELENPKSSGNVLASAADCRPLPDSLVRGVRHHEKTARPWPTG